MRTRRPSSTTSGASTAQMYQPGSWYQTACDHDSGRPITADATKASLTKKRPRSVQNPTSTSPRIISSGADRDPWFCCAVSSPFKRIPDGNQAARRWESLHFSGDPTLQGSNVSNDKVEAEH